MGLLDNFANNPLTGLGAGLLAAGGPSLNPADVSTGRGIQRGLGNMAGIENQRFKRQLLGDRQRQAQMEMALERRKFEAEQQASVREMELRGLLSRALKKGDTAEVRGLLAQMGHGVDATKGLLEAPKAPATGSLHKDLLTMGLPPGSPEWNAMARRIKDPAMKPPGAVDKLAEMMAQARLDDLTDKREDRAYKRQQGAEKAVQSADMDTYKAQRTLDDLDGVKALITDNATGITGAIGQFIPGSSADILGNRLLPIMSNIATDALNLQRKISATGASGFGALSEKELSLLQNSIATLKVAQDPAELRNAVDKVERHYRRLLDMYEKSQDAARKNLMRVSPQGGAPVDGGQSPQPPAGYQ